jgi:hypothetical protein
MLNAEEARPFGILHSALIRMTPGGRGPVSRSKPSEQADTDQVKRCGGLRQSVGLGVPTLVTGTISCSSVFPASARSDDPRALARPAEAFGVGWPGCGAGLRSERVQASLAFMNSAG